MTVMPTYRSPRRWAFMTNHASVLVCIANDSGIRVREISARVGITERATHRIVSELVDAGYITRTRHGRRNQYAVQTHLPLPDALARGKRVGDLLAILDEGTDQPRGEGGTGPGGVTRSTGAP